MTNFEKVKSEKKKYKMKWSRLFFITQNLQFN